MSAHTVQCMPIRLDTSHLILRMHKVCGDTVTIREYQECGYHSKQLKDYSMSQNHEHIKAITYVILLAGIVWFKVRAN